MPKPTRQRYRVEVKPQKGSRLVRVGRGRSHFTESIVRASFIPLAADGDTDATRPTVEMLISVDEHDGPEVHTVSINAGGWPLTPESIRLPLRAMANAAVACSTFRREGDTAQYVSVPGDTFVFEKGAATVEHLAPERLAELERELKPRPRNEVTDEALRRVAEIVARVPYRERREAVMDALDVSYFVAKARIEAARKKGFLLGSTRIEER